MIGNIITITYQVIKAAKERQTLPLTSLFLVIHLFLHQLDQTSYLLLISRLLITLNLFINVIGYWLLQKLYVHSIKTIFNRELPIRFQERIPSWSAHLLMLRPLEVIFRYFTCNLRVLPDIIVLGEVRCGTTSLCHHLASLPGCHTPFCLWKHPELDHKETFYFVGHYLGNVTPQYYAMCFPLKLTKWFHTKILKKPFFTFDGCAQYLTSPTAPYLIAEAYKLAKQKPPILIACVRDPVDQTLSWWAYENNAILWGSNGMGLSTWNQDLRSSCYPPKTITEAFHFSSSAVIEQAYNAAEQYVQQYVKENAARAEKRISHINLPPWSMTWPGGQLTGIGRNARYFSNIQRYEQVFSSTFCPLYSSSTFNAVLPSDSTLQFVNIFPIQYLFTTKTLKMALIKIIHQVDRRNGDIQRDANHNQTSHVTTNENFTKIFLDNILDSAIICRNPSRKLPMENLQPKSKDIQFLTQALCDELRNLEKLCRCSLTL